MVTILLIIFLVVYNIAIGVIAKSKNLFSATFLKELSQITILGLTLFILALPEGMPLAISIAMALSISRLKKDNILIKNLEAVQTCAMLHDLCVSKTGTITTGELKVIKFHFANDEKPKDNFPAQ
jgi:P-type E1-E2 ATPase